MYLEISARQTGKTTRLIDTAVKYLKLGKNIIVVTMSQRMLTDIRNEIIRRVGVPLTGSMTGTIYSNFKLVTLGKVFDCCLFDEFDFAMTPEVDSSYIRSNGYYYTTPRFVRDAKYRRQYNDKRQHKAIAFDLLLELARIKRYDRIVHFELPRDRAEGMIKNGSFTLEAYGVWDRVIVLPPPPEVKGLKHKYNITKADGSPVDEGSEYFVLRLDSGCERNHRKACLKALGMYIKAIDSHLPELASDLTEKYGLDLLVNWLKNNHILD